MDLVIRRKQLCSMKIVSPMIFVIASYNKVFITQKAHMQYRIQPFKKERA